MFTLVSFAAMARPQPGLEGQVVVVAGGSGTVGSGIVYEFLKCGAKVIVPLRGESSAKNLQAELDGSGSKGELDTFTCVVSDEASCTEFAKYINDKYVRHCVHFYPGLALSYGSLLADNTSERLLTFAGTARLTMLSRRWAAAARSCPSASTTLPTCVST